MARLNNFFYRISGPEQGRPWVFLHGLMGYANNWRKITSAIDETERVLVYDQRGHGKSFQPDSGYAPENYADDLKDILEELGWDQITLVGHSMGGRNALDFAHRYPQQVSRLVIEDIGPEPGSDDSKYRDLFAMIPTPFATKKAAKDFLLGEFPRLAAGRWQKPEVLSQYFYSNIEQLDDGRADWRFSPKAILESVEKGRQRELWDEVQSLSMPTLWIRGTQSNELGPEIYRRILECNSKIEGVEIADAGHWVHADQPEAFIKALHDFVLKHP